MAAVCQAYLEGASARRADDLVKAMGIEAMSKPEVSTHAAGTRGQPGGGRAGGAKAAIAAVLSEATWQRCRTRFMANLASWVPKTSGR